MIRALQWTGVSALALFLLLYVGCGVDLPPALLSAVGGLLALGSASEALLELRGPRRDPRDELPDLRALSDTGPGD